MANRIEQARAAVDACIREAYLRAAAALDLPEGADVRGSVEQPKDTANGDFAANHAMASAKTMHMAPRKIAEALIAHMDLDGTWFASVEAAGPGFLNFRLSDKWYQDVLTAVDDAGADYGRVDDGHGEKVMVEFVSANPTGPMTIGNRAAACSATRLRPCSTARATTSGANFTSTTPAIRSTCSASPSRRATSSSSRGGRRRVPGQRLPRRRHQGAGPAHLRARRRQVPHRAERRALCGVRGLRSAVQHRAYAARSRTLPHSF